MGWVVGTFFSSVLSIVFMLVLCCFLLSQFQLAANYEEDFSVCITTHGVEWVITTGLALKNRQVGLKATFQVGQHLCCLRVGENSQQSAALQARLFKLGITPVNHGGGAVLLLKVPWHLRRWLRVCGAGV